MLSVRELREEDISRIADYWLLSEPEHLEKMGVDLAKLPARKDFEEMLKSQLMLPIPKKRSYALIWEINGQPAGHCNTNPTTYGVEANLHLHLWKQEARYKGQGPDLLRLSLPVFFERLKLKKLIAEPYALNDAPNRILAKCGFVLTKEYITIPGSLNFEQPVKRWELSSEWFYGLKYREFL